MRSETGEPCQLTKIACFTGHVLPQIERWRRDKEQGYGCCPWHDDVHASMSIRPGDKVRFVWCCETGCDPADVRAGLLRRGIGAGCLGTYGTSRRPAARDADDSDAKKLLAISDALGATGTPAILRIRIRNIIDGGGDDLPRERAAFLALAERAGVKKSQRYEAWNWFYVSNGLG